MTRIYRPDRPEQRKPDWLRKCFEGCRTQDQWRDVFTQLTAKEQIDCLIRLQPREIKAENSMVIKLLIDGLQPKIVSGSLVETPAITDGDEDEDGV